MRIVLSIEYWTSICDYCVMGVAFEKLWLRFDKFPVRFGRMSSLIAKSFAVNVRDNSIESLQRYTCIFVDKFSTQNKPLRQYDFYLPKTIP